MRAGRVVFLANVLLFSSFVRAEEVVVDFSGGVSSTVQGVYVEKDHWFELPEDWDFPRPSELFLRLSHSPLLKRDLSTFTVFVNNTAITSFYLDKSNQDDATVKISIPPRVLKGGMNLLRFTIKMRTDLEDLCEDVYNPALWMAIDRSSRLVVQSEEKVITPDLSRFPRSYANPNLLYGTQKERVHAVIIVSEKPSQQEWDALASLASHLGREVGLMRGEFSVEVGGSIQKDRHKDKHIIVLGTQKFLKQVVGQFGIATDLFATEDAGRMQEFQSPINPKRRLLLLGGPTEEAIGLLAQNLGTVRVLQSLRGAVAQFDRPPAWEAREERSQETAFVLRLMDLRLSDITMRGKFFHTTSFTVPNPFVGQVKDGAFFRLSMSHSELLLPQSSSLLVKIGGEPLKSIRLTRETAERNTWDIKIPLQFLAQRFLTFEIEAFLDVGDPECYYYHPEMAWVSIYNDSLLYLPIDPNKPKTLANYPYMFLRWNGFNDLKVLLVEPLTQGIASAGFNALAFMSQSLRGDASCNATFVTSIENAKDANLLIVAHSGTIMSSKDFSPLLHGDLGGIASRPEVLNEVGILSISQNPFNAEKIALAIFARSDTELAYAAPYIYAPGKVEALLGDLAIVPSDGELRVLLPTSAKDYLGDFDPAKVAYEDKSGKITPAVEVQKTTQPVSRFNVAYLVFFVLSPILVLLVILRLRAIARESREE